MRKTFKNELKLSVDANQYYTFSQAVEMSKRLAEYNIFWFEEPLFNASLVELSKLAKLSPVRIATGENMNSHWQMQDACELEAAAVLQPDIIHQGGITEFSRSIGIIKQYNMILGTHLFHELSSSLAGLNEEHFVEHFDFFPDDFFINDFSI